MKKLHKLLAALLAVLILLSLAACGKNADEGAPTKADTSDAIGSILLSGETRVRMYYDKDGKVVAITDTQDQAIYTQHQGKACVEALPALLKEADPPIIGNFLLLKESVNGKAPTETFLQDLQTAAKAVACDKVILCTAADQDEHGYFSAKIAEAVLTAYLNYPANSCTVLSEPDGSYYEVSATSDGSSTTYTVDAIYGRVDVSLANSEPVPEEYNYDYFVDYGDNMFISDDPEAGLTEQ
jgi:YD repeat-containing protein